MGGVRTLHVLWSEATGPIVAYADPSLAYAHARTMVGVNVAACEVRDGLPEIVLDDLDAEYDGDDVTPPAVDVPLHEIDNGSGPDGDDD